MRPYELLKNFGIEYLEIRGIDLSPHDITGISKHHMRFLDLVLIYCLIKESPRISSKEKEFLDSINYVKNSLKGEVTDKTHHQKGLEQAKINLETLKSDTSKNINSIKKEAELSLNRLNDIPVNSKEEMDEYVGNYNLNI